MSTEKKDNISAKELKDRLIQYRDSMADKGTVTKKEFSIMNATIMAVFMILTDMTKPS